MVPECYTPVEVPSVVGKTIEEARRILEEKDSLRKFCKVFTYTVEAEDNLSGSGGASDTQENRSLG